MKARAWAGGYKIGPGTPPEIMNTINLYAMCQQFQALPSEVLKQDPEVLRAFRIIHNAEQDKAK